MTGTTGGGVHEESPFQSALRIFEKQRGESRQDTYPSLEIRRDNLDRLSKLLLENQDAISEAISTDYGNRSTVETRLLELSTLIGDIKYHRARIKRWMKPTKRRVSLAFAGAKNEVVPQPKGVVGIVTPWNYPLLLSIAPAVAALSAGNRVMIKLASNSQNLCSLLAELAVNYMEESHLSIVPGIKANDFSSLSWDHLVFTGSPVVGKSVMQTASENLTPVTLELGGKSPVVVTNDFKLETAVDRILFTKLLNAGQTCTAPDHVFVPEESVNEFVSVAKSIVAKRYPTLASPDYTSIIDERAYDRLVSTMQDARDRGAELISLIPQDDPEPESRKIPPHLVLGTTDEMAISKEEIFGPLLPVIPYKSIDEVIKIINSRERPLAIYIYSNSKATQSSLINRTMSGGVSINDCMFHAAQHDLPFGGVGNSGMGHYHGREGFLEFSKLRPIFKQGTFGPSQLMSPPYGGRAKKLVELLIKFKL